MILDRRHVIACALALPALGLFRPAWAEVALIFSPGGIAINGYDAVAYFTEGAAVPGSDQFMLKWRGAIWMFASAEHLEAFEMDPSAYAPQYGGYCAVAVADGRPGSSDPRAFAIRNGRLYLNHDESVLRVWHTDEAGFISRADAAWGALSDR